MPDFWKSIQSLREHYGELGRPSARGAFECILYEQAAYLQPDDKRELAFRELRRKIGTKPADLLCADAAELTKIAAIGGIFPELRARRMQESARIAGTLELTKKSLARFPMIGEPGAEKILLFCGTQPSLAPESNGLRVLVRLGFAEENKNYSSMYRDARNALAPVQGDQCEPLIEAHLLLKRHGQELCRRSAPRCMACPLAKVCPSANLRS